MSDEQVLRRWFALEMSKLLDDFVPVPRQLTDLLRESAPKATTRSGEPHVFDARALRDFAARLPALTRIQVRLPITFHIDNETPGDAYVSEPASIDALRALHVTANAPRDDRLWISTPLARDFARRYATLTQFVLH